MRKPAELRAVLEQAVPSIKKQPESLQVFIEAGSLRSTAVAGLSFEYAYTLTIVVTDFGGHADSLIIPIFSWLRTNQPSLIHNPDNMRDGFTFRAEIISNSSMDVEFKIKLTERVKVETALGDLPGSINITNVEHLPEPTLDLGLQAERWSLFILGEKVAEWDTTPDILG